MPRITARNNRYLRAIKMLFNSGVYRDCLDLINEASPNALTPEKRVEAYLEGFRKGDCSEMGLLRFLESTGQTVKE